MRRTVAHLEDTEQADIASGIQRRHCHRDLPILGDGMLDGIRSAVSKAGLRWLCRDNSQLCIGWNIPLAHDVEETRSKHQKQGQGTDHDGAIRRTAGKPKADIQTLVGSPVFHPCLSAAEELSAVEGSLGQIHLRFARKFAAAYTFSSTTQRGFRPFINSTIAAAAASLTCWPVS